MLDPSAGLGHLAGCARDQPGAPSNPACDVAHGREPGGGEPAGTLVAVFAGSVADQLLHLAAYLGHRTVLVEPDASRLGDGQGSRDGTSVADTLADAGLDSDCDLVVTDQRVCGRLPSWSAAVNQASSRRFACSGVLAR